MTNAIQSPPKSLRALIDRVERAMRPLELYAPLLGAEDSIESLLRSARALAEAVRSEDALAIRYTAQYQPHRLREAVRVLEAASRNLGMAHVNAQSGTAPPIQTAAAAALRDSEKPLTALEDAAQLLESAVSAEQTRRSPPPGRYLEGAERAASLVLGLYLVAKTGNRILPTEMLRIEVLRRVAPEDHGFWQAQRPEQWLGLLRHEPAIRSELARHGVLLWEGQRDQKWRLVNTANPVSHAEIVTLVNSVPQGGHCRFCQLEELDTGELKPIPGSGALTHEACEPHWQRCVGLALRGPDGAHR